jgi:hypothetical protein
MHITGIVGGKVHLQTKVTRLSKRRSSCPYTVFTPPPFKILQVGTIALHNFGSKTVGQYPQVLRHALRVRRCTLLFGRKLLCITVPVQLSIRLIPTPL